MAVTINEGTTFLISDDLGDVPEEGAFGLFSEDTRFLRMYRLLLDGQPPVPPRHAVRRLLRGRALPDESGTVPRAGEHDRTGA